MKEAIKIQSLPNRQAGLCIHCETLRLTDFRKWFLNGNTSKLNTFIIAI